MYYWCLNSFYICPNAAYSYLGAILIKTSKYTLFQIHQEQNGGVRQTSKPPQEMVDNLLKYGKKKKFAYGYPEKGGKYNDYLSPILNILNRVEYFKKKYPDHLKIYTGLLQKNRDQAKDAAIIKAKTEPLKFTYEDWRDTTYEMLSKKTMMFRIKL